MFRERLVRLSAVTWCPAAWNLHVELDAVHAEDGVSDVAQHVPTGGHTHERRQLLQLLKLGLPPEQRHNTHDVRAVLQLLLLLLLEPQ